MSPENRSEVHATDLASSRRARRRGRLTGRSLIAVVTAVTAVAALPAAANADGGQALLEVGRLGNGAPTAVNPGSLLSGLTLNEGAGGRFGISAGWPGTESTFTFTPPADTTIAGATVWPALYAYGWPSMSTWTELVTSWGDWNVIGVPGVGGIPGESSVNGLWSQGGGGMSVGASASLFATARQATNGSAPPQTGYFYADKLDVRLTDSTPPSIDQAPAADELFGAPNASGWYTQTTLPVALEAADRGLGVRWLLLKDGASVQEIALPGTGATCTTKDPDDSRLGGDTYTVKTPCPTAPASYTVPVYLSELGDGAHTLSLGVRDAAGSTRWSPTAYTVRTNAEGGALADPGTACPNGTVDDSGACIAVPPANTSPPRLTGSVTQGQTIFTDTGAWDHIDGVAWTYEWELCDADGTGCSTLADGPGAPEDATTVSGDRVMLGVDSVGRRLRSTVTATTSSGTVAARSALSAPIAAMVPVNTVAPALSGAARVGQELTTTTGTWTNTTSTGPLPAVAWQRCDAAGGSCVDIGDTGGTTYTLTGADVAHTVRSRVRRVNTGGGSATSSSEPSPIVFPAAGSGNGGAGAVIAVEPVRVSGSGGRAGVSAVVELDDAPLPVPDPPANAPVDRINGTNPAGGAVKLTARLAQRGVLRSGRGATITGRVTTLDGSPVAGARIDVVSHLWMAGARGEIAGAATTEADGSFTFAVEAGPSRIVTLGYRLHLADRTYAATAPVKVQVRPTITLRADRVTVAVGDTVRLSGRVTGAPSGSRHLAQLQALVHGRWTTFATTRLVDGRISYRHRFWNTIGTRVYSLRALVTADAHWPFVTSASRAVRITVSGSDDRRSGEGFR
jgi:hypothetical protein